MARQARPSQPSTIVAWFSLSFLCGTNVTVYQLDHRDRLAIHDRILFLRNVPRVKCGSEVVSQLVDRSAALAAKLNILLIGVAPEAFRDIRGHRNRSAADLCR